jgi:hypothetical protein
VPLVLHSRGTGSYTKIRTPSARFRWKSKKSAGNLKNLLENKISSRKSKFPAERGIFRWKSKKSPGKKFFQRENAIFR